MGRSIAFAFGRVVLGGGGMDSAECENKFERVHDYCRDIVISLEE